MTQRLLKSAWEPTFLTGELENADMGGSKLWLKLVCVMMFATSYGCGLSPEGQKAAEEGKHTAEVSRGESEAMPVEDEPAEENKIRVDQSGEFGTIKDLKLAKSRLQFTVPETWKKVPSPANIVEAEFQLPKAKGDEFDGRLTLMPSGGSLDEMITEWEGEFDEGTRRDSKDESLTLGGKKATWVDRRGTWHGTRHGPVNTPRKNYRLIVVVIPLSETHACFIKLTGPEETIAIHEKELRSFVNSMKPLEEQK